MPGSIQNAINNAAKTTADLVTTPEATTPATPELNNAPEITLEEYNKESEAINKDLASYGRQREIALGKKEKINDKLSKVETQIAGLTPGSDEMKAALKMKATLGSRRWSINENLRGLKNVRELIQGRQAALKEKGAKYGYNQ